jgi:NADH:ubiquinone oxidoreductase subunit 3 (subunit A)
MAMSYNLVAQMFFVVLGLSIPILFLFAAKLISRRSSNNPVKNAPYEGTEESLGGRGASNEYLPYMILFIPFNVVLSILILWSLASKVINYETSIAIIFLVATAMVFSFIGYKLIGGVFGKSKTLY